MPTLLIVDGFRFFFYSNENHEPVHVHISKGSAKGKVWIQPAVNTAYFIGFTPKEKRFVLETVEMNESFFKAKWHEYFRK